MVGTYLYAFSDTHRMEEMTPKGLYDPDDTEALIDPSDALRGRQILAD
jgi:hypothetical protein